MRTYILPILLSAILLSSCMGPSPAKDAGRDATMSGSTTVETGSGADISAKNIDLFADLDKVQATGASVTYAQDGSLGYIARPARPGVYPAVVMIHEWWGLNDHIKNMARILADEGYVVLAVDLYQGEVATDPAVAGKKAGEVRENPAPALANMQAAVAYLRTQPDVQSEKIASLGWCFGGQQSLNLALGSKDLAATVIYYGNLVTDAERLASITWPVLGIFGETDTSVPVESVRAFESALKTAGVEQKIYVYPGVGHAFANPSGQRYAPKETVDAWEKTLNFLRAHLGA